MILYTYECDECKYEWDDYYEMDKRDEPCACACPSCGEYRVNRRIGIGGFSVPEGGYGNAANGYSTTHGDAENFKAKSKGVKPPYEGVKRLKD